MSAAPGWYPDPAGSPDLRFWDGTGWTPQSRSAEPMPSPMLQPAPVRQVPLQQSPFQREMAGVAATASPAYDFYGSAVPSTPPPGEREWSGPARPAPKSKRPLFTGIGVGVVAIIAAAVAIPMAIASPGSIYQRTHIAMPKSAAGFKQLAEVNSKVSTTFAQKVPFSGARIGSYTTADGAPDVMLVVAHVQTDPARFSEGLNEAKTSGATTDDEHKPVDLSGLEDTGPGPLGGQMQCGTFQADGTSVAACIFVDEGAEGMLFINNASTVDTTLMLRLRAAVEKRN